MDSQKSGSEPTSPSPHSVNLQRPMLPPKPKISDSDLNVLDLPPRPAPLLPPRKPRGGKDNMLVQSFSYVDGLNSQPPPDRHRSPSIDVPVNQYAYKRAPALPFTENGSHYKTLPPFTTLDTPTASSDSHLYQDSTTNSPQGFGKPPAPPPPATSSSTQSGDYPPYDKLTPIGSNYDTLTPITLPQKPTQVENVPPLPPRSATETQPARPPLPPKANTVPPLPPKGSSKGN